MYKSSTNRIRKHQIFSLKIKLVREIKFNRNILQKEADNLKLEVEGAGSCECTKYFEAPTLISAKADQLLNRTSYPFEIKYDYTLRKCMLIGVF